MPRKTKTPANRKAPPKSETPPPSAGAQTPVAAPQPEPTPQTPQEPAPPAQQTTAPVAQAQPETVPARPKSAFEIIVEAYGSRPQTTQTETPPFQPTDLAEWLNRQRAEEYVQNLPGSGQNASGYEMWMGTPESFLEATDPSKRHTVGEEFLSAFRGAQSAPLKAVEELGETVNAFVVNPVLNTLEHLGLWNDSRFPEEIDAVPEIWKPKTQFGRAVQTLTAFSLKSYLLGAVGKAVKPHLDPQLLREFNIARGSAEAWLSTSFHIDPSKVSSVMDAVGRGFIVDLTRNPKDAVRYADKLAKWDNPICNNAFMRYLRSDPNDSDAVARFKNAVEGILPNAVSELLILYAKDWFAQFHPNAPRPTREERIRAFQRVRENIENDRDVVDGLPQSTGPVNGSAQRPVAAQQETPQQTTPPQIGNGPYDLTPTGGDTRLNKDFMTEQAGAITDLTDANVRAAEKANPNSSYLGTVLADAKTVHDKVARELIDNLDDFDAPGVIRLENEVVKANSAALEGQMKLAATFQIKNVPELEDALENYLAAQKTDVLTPEITETLRNKLTDTIITATSLVRVRKGFGRNLQSLQRASYFDAAATPPVLNIDEILKDKDLGEILKKIDPPTIQQIASGVSVITQTDNSAKAMTWLLTLMENIAGADGKTTAAEVFRSWFDEFLYFSRLSGANTHVRNIIENAIRVGPINQSDVFWSTLFEGGSLSDATEKQIFMLRGMREGWTKSLEALRLAAKHGGGILDGTATPQVTTVPDSAAKKVLQAPGLLLNIEDELAAQPTYSAQAFGQLFDAVHSPEFQEAFRNAPESVKKDFERKFVEKFYKDLGLSNGAVARGMTASRLIVPDIGLDSNAAFEETQRLLMKSGMPATRFGGSVYRTLADIKNIPYIGPFIMPFPRASYNIAKDALYNHGPFGLYRAFDPSLTPEQKSKALGQIMTTIILYVGVADLVASGKITGGGPDSPAAKAAWREQGKLPYSIRLGNDYYPIGNISAAAPAVLVADMYEKLQDRDYRSPEGVSVSTAALNAFSALIAERTVFTGLTDFVSALDKNDYSYFLNSGISSFIGGQGFNTLRHIIDSDVRETRDHFGPFPTARLADRFPVASYLNPPKYSWLTGEIVQDAFTGGLTEYGPAGRAMQVMLFPVSQRNTRTNELFLTTMAKTSSIKGPDRILSTGAILDDTYYSEYCRLIGKMKLGGRTLEQQLTDLFKTEAFQNAGSDPSPSVLSRAKEELIRPIVNGFIRAGEEKLMERHPEILEYAQRRMKIDYTNRRGETNDPLPEFIPDPSRTKPLYQDLLDN